MQLSFKLGLRVQEIALLRIREVAQLGSRYPAGYHIKDVLVLPKSFTKGARALKVSKQRDTKRTSVRFTIAEFDRLVQRIAKAGQTGQPVVPTDYYPALKKSGGKTRELPLADDSLVAAIGRYLNVRSALPKPLTPNAPLVLSQKGGPYGVWLSDVAIGFRRFMLYNTFLKSDEFSPHFHLDLLRPSWSSTHSAVS